MKPLARAAASLLALAELIAMTEFASAQPTIAPAVIRADDKEYRRSGITAGAVRIEPSFDFSAEFNDNVYASPVNRKSDAVFTASPQLRAIYSRKSLELVALGQISVRRYASLKTENAVSAVTAASAVWRPQNGLQAGADVGYSRLIEDRGDVERLANQASGPRRTDLFTAGVRFRRERGRILFDLAALAQKYDALAARDADRDFKTYSLVAKTGLRIAGSTYATLTGFMSYRDFELPAATGLYTRDSKTYGARAGLDFTSNAYFDGHVGVGVFRFDANADQIEDHTGLSIDAALTYRPRRRTAFVFNAFRGDVATFRLGASSRTDTSFNLAVQQEIRHNLFGAAGAGWRETRYRNNANVLRTAEAKLQAEYLFSRRLSTIGTLTYAKRTSNSPFDRYERFRANLAVSLAF